MSRLIRDTDIINAIEEWRSGLVCTPSQYADCVVDGTLETVEEVIVDKAPTAYDVEAVVREFGKIDNGCGEIPHEEAIAIVRRGGRNE